MVISGVMAACHALFADLKILSSLPKGQKGAAYRQRCILPTLR
jgi:hypothetical protein